MLVYEEVFRVTHITIDLKHHETFRPIRRSSTILHKLIILTIIHVFVNYYIIKNCDIFQIYNEVLKIIIERDAQYEKVLCCEK